MQQRKLLMALGLIACTSPKGAPAPQKPDRVVQRGECLVYARNGLTQLRPINVAGAARARTRGLSLAQSGNHSSALDAFREALLLDPVDGLTHLAKAQSHLVTDNNPSTISKHLQSAVTLLPKNPRARLYYGDAFREAGDRARAIQEYKCALQLRPDLSPARFRLGALLFETNQSQAAAHEVQNLLKAKPGHLRARILWARILESRGNLRESAIQLERAARRSGQSAPLYRQASKLYRRIGNIEAAQALEGEANLLDPPQDQRVLRPLPRARRRR